MAVAPALGAGMGNAGRLRAGRIGKYRCRPRLSTPNSRPRIRCNRFSTIYSADGRFDHRTQANAVKVQADAGSHRPLAERLECRLLL
jgi:hypothetical protein